MNSPITNRYDPNASRVRLVAEEALLYQPETEWTYSHHPFITAYQDRLYAIWSNGRVHEDNPGQRILFATAESFDKWSDPRPLVDTQPGEHSEVVLTAAGFHQYEGTLAAFFGQYEYTPDSVRNGVLTLRHRHPLSDEEVVCHHMNTCLRSVITADGAQWSQIQEVTDPRGQRLPIVPNHGPQKTSSGRLILSGNVSFPYTDDPSGLSGWRMTGIFPAEMTADVYDDSEGTWLVREKVGWDVWPLGLCEGSFFQTDDGIVHMLLRSTGKGHVGRLWLTESQDDGATWSAPHEVDFSDNCTKFHFGRLPDGRYYYVGCPDPGGNRCPLVLSISEDGVNFCRHFVLADSERPYVQRTAGEGKGGLYGYPHTMIHDGCLYVIVSLFKEGVQVLRVPCSDF